MNRHFWLDDEQWAIIEPLLPQVHTGPDRVDDRRIVSGILHRFREGCTWRAMPAVYGPYTTVFNRYNRWSQRGLWQGIFAALVGDNDRNCCGGITYKFCARVEMMSSVAD